MKIKVFLAITLVALLFASLTAGTYEQYGLEPVAIVVDDHSHETFERTRDILGALGARGLCLFPPDAIIGYVPIDFTQADMSGLAVDVIRTADKLSGKFLGQVEKEAIAAFLNREGDQPHWIEHEGEMIGDAVLYVPPEIVEKTSTDGSMQGSAQDIESRNIHQNSEFMLGSILVNVIFPESQAGTENWTDDEIAEVIQFITRGCGDFVQHTLWTDLGPSFTINYEDYRRIPVSNEPIEVGIAMDTIWISEALDNLGYPGDSHLLQVHDLNNDTRGEFGTEWVFTAFVVDASENECWAVRDMIAYSWFGGPFMVIPYPTCEYGDSLGFSHFFVKEMCHIFWAMNEDAGSAVSCLETSGYIPILNRNSRTGERVCAPYVPCIMNDDPFGNSWPGGYIPVCNYTMAQVGFTDNTGNKIPDIYEVRPVAQLQDIEDYNLDTILTLPYKVAIEVHNDARENRNPYQLSRFPDEMIDYAPSLRSGRYRKIVNDEVIGSADIDPPEGGWTCDNELLMEIYGLSTGDTRIEYFFTNDASMETFPISKTVTYISIHYVYTELITGEEQIDIGWLTSGQLFGAYFDIMREDISDGTGEELIGTVTVSDPPNSGETRYHLFSDQDIEPAHQYRYRVVGKFSMYIGGTLRSFEIETNDIYTVSQIPKGSDFISNLLPNPTAGKTSFTVEVPKSWHDPAGGQSNMTLPASTASPALEEIHTPVEIHVYNIKGQRIHTIFSNNIYGETRTFTWHGLDKWGKPVAPGIYFIRVQAGGHVDTKKVVIIR